MDASVIVPYRDRPALVLNTLRSLEQQVSEYSFEVIVVDDGSETPLDPSHLHSLSIARIVRTEPGGAAKARNAGLRVAQGEVVIFLDCDQIVDENFVQSHCRPYFDHPGRRLAQIGERRRLAQGQEPALASMPVARIEARNALFQILSFNLQAIECAWHLFYSHNASALRRDLEMVGGFDEGFRGWGLEDCELGYRLHKAGVAIVYNPMVTALHQFHDETFHQNKFEAWLRNLDHFESRHEEFAVRAQRLLADFFDPAVRAASQTDWLSRMLLMEKVMRLVHHRERPVRQSTARRIADHDTLMAVIRADPRAVILLKRDQLDLAVTIQIEPACRQVFLVLE